jgi:kynurenine--oxoglutarate transaminase/cysteine-S-conjugate beta-lyase/glutamine--phenylpyruvate transaminase
LKVAENEYQGFPSYYQWIRNEYQGNRDKLLKILKFSNRVRLSPLLSEGGFFLCARILDGGEFIPHRFRQTGSLDFAFCRWSTEELKLSAIPCSAFFSEKNKAYGEGIVRFALCKDRDDYEKAEKILMV